MSEQCTAPHMFRQHASAMRSLPGNRLACRRSTRARSSITAFTTPDASVAAEWQCTQPCVCTMLEMAGPMPPTGWPSAARSCDERVDVRLVGQQELDVVPAGEAQVAVAVLVRQLRVLADPLGAQQPGRAGPHREELVTRLADVDHHARLEDLVVLPLPVVLLDDRRQEPPEIRRADVRSSSVCPSDRISLSFRRVRIRVQPRSKEPPPYVAASASSSALFLFLLSFVLLLVVFLVEDVRIVPRVGDHLGDRLHARWPRGSCPARRAG